MLGRCPFGAALVAAEQPLHPVPEILVDDRFMFTVMELALVRELADIDWVGEQTVEMPPAEWPAAGDPAVLLMTDLTPNGTVRLKFQAFFNRLMVAGIRRFSARFVDRLESHFQPNRC